MDRWLSTCAMRCGELAPAGALSTVACHCNSVEPLGLGELDAMLRRTRWQPLHTCRYARESMTEEEVCERRLGTERGNRRVLVGSFGVTSRFE